MARSRVQLATTYAPGVLFTWEGAKGICRSVPIDRATPPIEEATQLLIFDGIKEIASNWLQRASTIRTPDAVPMQLMLDDVFYNPRTYEVEVDRMQHFQLNDPGVMGYVPYPLLYQCAHCDYLQEYESIEEQSRRPLPLHCHGHEARWTQVDVVYVHWSGALEPLSPYRYNYDTTRQVVTRIRQCQCGSQDFQLKRRGNIFATWQFVCEGCGDTRDLKQPEPVTLGILEREQQGGGRNFERIEVNMLPVSYRANAAFYPQKGSFIEFRDRSVVELLLPQRQNELLQRVAEIHGFAFTSPSENEIVEALQAVSREAEWQEYGEILQLAANAQQRGQTARADERRQEAAELREGWYRDGIIQRGQVQSPALVAAVVQREGWARRYDPIRLTIEHDRFRVEHIQERRTSHEAVDVMQPDRLICDAVGNPDAMARYQSDTGSLLNRIGFEQVTLIRGLPICEFSFGFSRVSSTPVYQREFNNRSVAMPVKLNAFPRLPNNRHPVYVTQQKNEALYFRLNEERVRRWLVANDITNVPVNQGIGAAYLESYQDFRPFLDRFKNREGQGGTQRFLADYTYLLLHSMAHQVMHALADVSGLDSDGLGEYIFPADLAFVVYRKGMTQDLGNISAMWRNNHLEFLRRMLDSRLLRCGSGSLCDSRGGACPACIMVSEVTCITSNQLLSRAALRGGPAPNWEPQNSSALIGFFDPMVMS
ncbi:MAG: hypothetical protein J0M34_08310 [Alphaproteobacteria bacterium]|nr:hypothetical protein [Alphaproteobacteria bacterium]